MSKKSLVLASTFSLVVGCGPADSEDTGDSFLQRDSSGVAISVNLSESAQPPLGWEIDWAPEVVIGEEEDGSGYLYRVQGVRGFEDGRILVVDGQRAELRFFDSQGQLLERFGGKGEGPGEFLDPVLVPWTTRDSLLLFDKGILRFQVFTTGGRAVRTIRLAHGWPSGIVPPIGAVGRHMLVNRKRIVGGEATLRQEGLRRLNREFFWFDVAMPGEVPLDTLVYGWSYRSGNWETSVPFFPNGAAAVTSGGAFIADGRSGDIRKYDVDGRLRQIIRVRGPRRAVTEEMVDAAIDLTSVAQPMFSRERWASEYGRIPLPDSLPVFQTLLVDELGWLWAEVYGWDPRRPKEWIVFDSIGHAQGVVQSPPGLEVQSIGRDYVLGIWRDEWDVEFVRRHALRRNALLPGSDQDPY